MSSVKKRLLRIYEEIRRVSDKKDAKKLNTSDFSRLKKAMQLTSLDELGSLALGAGINPVWFKDFTRRWNDIYGSLASDKTKISGFNRSDFMEALNGLRKPFEGFLYLARFSVLSEYRDKLNGIMSRIAGYFEYTPSRIDVMHIDKSVMEHFSIMRNPPANDLPSFISKRQPRADMIDKTIEGKLDLEPVWIHECLHIYHGHVIDDVSKIGLKRFGFKLGLDYESMDYLSRLSKRFNFKVIMEGFAHFCTTELFSKNIFQKLLSRSFDLFYYIAPQYRKPYILGYNLMRRIVYPRFGKKGVLFIAATSSYFGDRIDL